MFSCILVWIDILFDIHDSSISKANKYEFNKQKKEKEAQLILS